MLKQTECKTEDYTDNRDILFRYVLSDIEKKIFCDIAYDVVNKYNLSQESKLFVESRKLDYDSLLSCLTGFFTKTPGVYFLRLSTLSPKDACYYLNRSANDVADLSNETSDEIKNSLNILKVTSPMECIQVLFHSYRVFCELDHSTDMNAVLLLPWKNIVHDTETRCYVNNKRLIAISQYYTDCIDSYVSVISIDDFYRKIVDFVNYYIKNNELLSVDKFVIDLSQEYNSRNIMMIELNIYDRNTDSCLFTWDEIDNLCTKECKPVFRYMVNKIVIEK